jgi:hypothetical protein
MPTEWLTVKEAAGHAKCGTGSIYLAVRQQKLQAARLGGRRELRFLVSWIDAWLLASTTPALVNETLEGDDRASDQVKSAAH